MAARAGALSAELHCHCQKSHMHHLPCPYQEEMLPLRCAALSLHPAHAAARDCRALFVRGEKTAQQTIALKLVANHIVRVVFVAVWPGASAVVNDAAET